MSEKIYFYQNNPCTIIRSVSEEFAEIRLSHHFAGDMELTGQCEGCNVGDSDNKLSCTCDEHSWIIEEVQNEENLLLVMIEKRLLTEDPVEYLTIKEFKKEIDQESELLTKTKELHEEWRNSMAVMKLKVQALQVEAASLELSTKANLASKEQSEMGLSALTDEYNKILVHIGLYKNAGKHILTKDYDYLLKRDETLSALEAGGVDNWEWYDESLKDFKESM